MKYMHIHMRVYVNNDIHMIYMHIDVRVCQYVYVLRYDIYAYRYAGMGWLRSVGSNKL